jgi:hypothetical protein
MADKADQALKLAQKNEKDLKALQDFVTKIEKNLREAIDERAKKMIELHNEQDKRYTELHNKQDAKIQEVVAWAQKTFDTKGWF